MSKIDELTVEVVRLKALLQDLANRTAAVAFSLSSDGPLYEKLLEIAKDAGFQEE